MKRFVFLAILLLLVDLSVQITLLVNCPRNFAVTDSMKNSCDQLTCDGPGRFSGLICAEYRCAPGKQIGYREDDNSKVYPACCGGPICAD